MDELQRAGVRVFDASAILYQEARASGQPEYLKTDTHWRPEAMMRVAARLAGEIRSMLTLPEVPDPQYRTESVDVTAHGDVFKMLDLSERQALFEPETVTVRRILAADDASWRPSRNADVLVLGDSFANIYALESMAWGTSAGLVEQLSYELRRPVDRLVQNDAGAYATREMLRRAGADRLNGKRVVIWQFAAREFAFGDWKVF
jgi:alginate O-acetyltransferase complex protein AlgJ